MAERLDVIIFGATGFTGKHTVLEGVKLLENLKWGIAGRNKEKLENVLKEVEGKTKADLSKIPIIIADVNDEKSLQEMAEKCKIVVNTCGPYRFFGEQVVKACVNAGTHHVDVSGEPQYMENMQLKYNDLAKEKGVYVISACGFDSIPADMGTVFVENHFDGVVNSIETYLESWEKGGNSGGAAINYGTWESAVYGLAHADELRGIRTKLFKEELPRLAPKLKNRSVIHKSTVIPDSYCLPFPGSDRSVVMRSQRIFYETEKKRPIQMKAYVAFRSLLHVIVMSVFAVVFAIMTKFSFGRSLLLKYPQIFSGGMISHEGPSEEKMKNTNFALTLYAQGWNKDQKLAEPSDQYTNPPNKTLLAKVSGENPGYGATCVALLLAAITVLKENEKMPGSGGVLPPGAAFAKTSMIDQLGYFSKAPSHYSLLLLTIIVINCCGPYTFHGEQVIKACLNAGTHQVDISAEMQFIETMQLKYNDLAQEKGVYIISACGFGYIPFDLGTIFVEDQFKGVVNSVEIYCEAGDYPGGVVAHYGTWESIVLSIANIFDLRGIRRQLYKEELPRLTPKLKLKLIQKPAILNGSYALIDPACENDVALRSQRFLYEQHKKRPVQIRTYMVFPKFIYVMFAGLCAVILGILTRFSCGTKLVLRYPKFFSGGIASHEGPTEEDMKNTSFIFTFYAEGWADKLSEPADQYPKRPNKALYAKVTGPNPAYGSTCVAFLLSAITILKENHNIPGRGGVLPPGAAFAKTTLIEQLGKYENGMKFEVISTKTI